MTIYFQGALRPVCRWLARAGVTATQVTIAALLLSLVLGGLLALFPAERRPLFLIPAGLLVRMALNAIDGNARARAWHGERAGRHPQ